MWKSLRKISLISFIYRQKIGTRLGAIGLASLLWLFVISENEYTMSVDIRIEARNLPAQLALKEEVPGFAKIRLKGMGRSLFKTLILKNFIQDFKLVLDLEKISEEYDFILNDYFERYPQKVSIPSSFDVTYIEVIYPSSIHISLDEYKEKTVEIIPNLLIELEPGYTRVGRPKISPEKIKIAGSRDIVENITKVSTQPDTLKSIMSNISINMKIEEVEGELIEYSSSVINYWQKIQSISERIISEIPVKVINAKENLQYFVSPQTVSLTVVGGTDYISNLNSEDIEVSVDFDNWRVEKQFYELDVLVPLDVINWMDLSPKNIELVVTQRVP